MKRIPVAEPLVPLDEGHWTHRDFTQRMTVKQWRRHLLNGSDKFLMHRGEGYRLVAKSLGCGVVEISKAPLHEKNDEPKS